MKLETPRITAAFLPLILAACSSIGDGNGPESIEIVMSDGSTDAGEAFQCLAATPQAVLTFDNGSASNFARRAEWSSDNEDVLRVSDGTIEAGNDEFFVNGALLPVSPGQATLSVRYLSFEDSITVTVNPTKIELSPQDHTVVQGNQLNMVATGILDGSERISTLDMTGLGVWSVTAADGGDPVSTIDSTSGRLSANEAVAGVDQVNFAVDFCNRAQNVDVAVVNQTLQSIRLVRRDDPDAALDSVSLPPDASARLQVLGEYSGGMELDLTAATTLAVANDEIAYTGVRGRGVVTSFEDVKGQSTELTATFDPDSTIEGDELTSNTVSLQALDVTLDPASLAIDPMSALMLNGSSRALTVSGQFSGPDGDVEWDLTRDVVWSSADAATVLVSNSNGARGVAISSGDLDDVGEVIVAATRQLGDGPEEAPTATIIAGAANEDDAPVEVVGLTVSADSTTINRGDRLQLSATGELSSETQSGSQDLSPLVIWSSSDESVAVVDNSSIARGQVTVLTDAADQSVTITGTFSNRNQDDDVQGSIELTVNPTPAR